MDNLFRRFNERMIFQLLMAFAIIAIAMLVLL